MSQELQEAMFSTFGEKSAVGEKKEVLTKKEIRNSEREGFRISGSCHSDYTIAFLG